MIRLKLKPVSDQVIVITGASSGIGLATAQSAARQGARVVLAARSAEALQQAVDEITAAGGTAISAVADVANRADLESVAQAAIARFGRIDTWVNNAGVSIWGRLEEVSEEDMRRLFETNFWGMVNGSLAALPHLKAAKGQGLGGALINVGSMASDRALPLQGIYSASKFAVKGFTEALRVELDEERAPVSVTLVKPGSIGTPLPQHAKNYTTGEPKLPPPIYGPEEVAMTILHAAAHPVRDAFVGSSARTISALSQTFPGIVDWVSARVLVPAQVGPKPPSSAGDNLHAGRAEDKVRGDQQGSMIRPSVYTRATLHPGVTTAVLGLAAVGLGRMLADRPHPRRASRRG